MDAAILAIGTELTRGELIDSNSGWLSARLHELGVDVVEHCSVPDDESRVASALVRLSGQVELLLSTGGLGPTSDDLTTACAAVAMGVPLQRDQGSAETIRERYRRYGAEMAEAVLKQADFPRGADVMANDVGTAPGFSVTIGRARCHFMPGVPGEMQHLFERHVAPDLERRVQRTDHQIHLRTCGLGESAIAEKLADLDAGGARAVPGVTLGYRASPLEVEVKVLARAESAEAAQRLAQPVADEIGARLHPYVYGGKGDSFPDYVGGLLRDQGLSLSLAESCTGGLIGKLLTDLPGSSDYLKLSAVTYANSAKRDVLGVDLDLLERCGAVSEEVAAAMAEGARRVADSDLAVAVTGIAGPGGGSDEKPVGTVCFGLAQRDAEVTTERKQFGGSRARVRLVSAYNALHLVAGAARRRLTDERAQN